MQLSKFIVDRQQLLKNFKNLGTTNICVMVKANAYGTGLETICKTLFGKAKFFGTATIEEALLIRKFDKYSNILVVGLTYDFITAINNNISITIDNLAQIENLDKLINELKINKKIKVHIKINSGMNRLGINNKKTLKNIIKIIKNNKKIIFEGVFTHFSTINEDIIFLNKQLKVFKEIIKIIPPQYNPIKHIGGGEVLKKVDIQNFDNYMFRVGFNLYNNIIKITSQIIKINYLKEGDRLGYSNGFIANRNYKIAVIPLGYADGVNRKLSSGGYVKINNKKCFLIGNVCMDMFFVDVSNINCKIGDIVNIFTSPFIWAKICDTIPYEILTSLSYKRMKYIVNN